ncbi:MAG: O-antigen ligase family protein [Candidatus Sulfopaludibacter sp.]|nr:O-antigen ligase family protein [Candidatus Sulfopaludibacter sp.]
MGILQAALIGLAALIITPGYFFYFDVTPKVAVVLLGTAAALIWSAFSQGGSGAKVRWFAILVALQTLSLALSTALSARPALSLTGTNWRRYGALVQATVLIFAWLVAWHTAGQPHRIRTILRTVAATGAAAALYGIAQFFGWDPFLPAAAYRVGEGVWTIVRPPGTLGYVSYFATWLLFTIFLSLTLARMETSPAWRQIGYAAAALALIAMLLTGTRAALLGLAVGACVWLFRNGFRIPRNWLLAAAGSGVALAAFYVSPAGQPLRSRVRWFVEDPWGGARPHLWRDSFTMFLHRPAAGYGPETFTAEFPRFQSLELARAYPDFVHESPHNIFLDAAVAQGVPGLLILCCLLALGFRTANAGLAAALAAGIVAQQFTVFTLPTALITFTTIALAASESRASLRLPKLVFLPATLLLYAAIRLMVSDHALALTQKSLAAADEASATAHYAHYQSWRLPGASADLWYSRASLTLAQKTANPAVRFQALIQAAGAGVRATETAEDSGNAWYSLAVLYAAQNDAANTAKCLRAAAATNPNWFKPHWTLARLLRMQGRLPEAQREAAIAVRCDGGKNAEVSRTLAEIRAGQP